MVIRLIGLFLVMGLWAFQASAEIIEINGGEIVDGEILSQENGAMKFKDGHGNVRDLDMKNVKVLDATKKTPVDKFKKITAGAQRVVRKITDKASSATRSIDEKKKKFMQPLDSKPKKSNKGIGKVYRESMVSSVKQAREVRKQLKAAGYGPTKEKKRFKTMDF